jgi:hypothetical protein
MSVDEAHGTGRARGAGVSSRASDEPYRCFDLYLISRTLSEDDAHRGNIDDSAPSPSRPAPSARRYAALGLDRSTRPSKPARPCRQCARNLHRCRTTSDRSSAGFLILDGMESQQRAGARHRPKREKPCEDLGAASRRYARNDGVLGLLQHPILQHRLLAADLLTPTRRLLS